MLWSFQWPTWACSDHFIWQTHVLHPPHPNSRLSISLSLCDSLSLSLCISMSRRFSLNSLTCALPHHWSNDLPLVGIVYLTLSLNNFSFSLLLISVNLYLTERKFSIYFSLSLSLSLSLSWCLSHSLTLLPLSWAPSHWCCCLSKYSFSLSLTNSHFLFLSVT